MADFMRKIIAILACRSEILSVQPHEKGGHMEHEHGDHAAAKHYEVEKCAALISLSSMPATCMHVGPVTAACLLRPSSMELSGVCMST